MVEELKSQIEKSFGKKIITRGDCELLSEDLYKRTGVVISYNTFRRMFGLAEYRQPRLTTLNHLSNYIGFQSYQDFTQRFSEVDSWPTWETLYVTLSTGSIKEIIEMLRYRQVNNLQFATSFTVVTRELLLRNDCDLLVELFRCPYFQFSKMPYDDVAQIGVLTGLLFRTHSNTVTERRLLRESNFRDLILKIYVDYARLNGKYGQWINWLLRFKGLDDETSTFIRCVAVWRRVLNAESFLSLDIQVLPKLSVSLHPILFGRIFGLKFLASENTNYRKSIVRQMNARLNKYPELRSELLHEPAIQSLVTRNKKLVDFVYEHVQIISEIHRWYHLSQMSILKVFQVSVLISKSEFTRANSILENISIGHIRYGYREFIELYISFFRVKIFEAMKRDAKSVLLDFSDRRKKMNYPIFTEEYFQDYFAEK